MWYRLSIIDNNLGRRIHADEKLAFGVRFVMIENLFARPERPGL